MQLQSPTKASGLKDLTDQLEFDFAGPNEKMLKKAFVAGYSAGEDDRPTQESLTWRAEVAAKAWVQHPSTQRYLFSED